MFQLLQAVRETAQKPPEYTRSGEIIIHLASRRLDEPDASGRAHNVEPAIGVRSRPRRGIRRGRGERKFICAADEKCRQRHETPASRGPENNGFAAADLHIILAKKPARAGLFSAPVL
jgi:hypothetical protein